MSLLDNCRIVLLCKLLGCLLDLRLALGRALYFVLNLYISLYVFLSLFCDEAPYSCYVDVEVISFTKYHPRRLSR